jgi:hypothetical protein
MAPASEKPAVSLRKLASTTSAPETQKPQPAAARKEFRGSRDKRRTSALGSRLKHRSLALFRIAQVIVWTLGAVRRHALISAAGIIALAALAFAPVYPLLWPYRILFWSLAGLVALVGLGAMSAAVFNEVLQRLQHAQKMAQRANGAQFAALGRRLDRFEAKINGIEAKINGIEAKINGIEARLEAQINGSNVRSQDVSRKLSFIISRLAKVEEERPIDLINKDKNHQRRLAGEVAVLTERLAQIQRRVEDLSLRECS